MNSGVSVNWIAAYNRLFLIMDRSGQPTYCMRPGISP